MEEINFFAENLRYFRHLKGMSLAEFGELFGLGKSQISLYENAKCYPPIEKARTICKHLDITLDNLFEKDIRPPEPPKNSKASPLSKAGALQENDVGATESPPTTKEEVKEMKRQILEFALKLEAMQD